MKKFRKLTAVLLVLVMLLFSGTTVMAASSFSVPTEPMSTDDGVIKVSAMRAGQIAPLILGADLVATSNLGASSDDYNKVTSILGVFGSDINESPDPYLYNYFYNLYAADNGKSTVENATIAETQMEGTGQTTEVIQNVLTHRPQLILSQAPGTGSATENSSYADVIKTLPENTDSDTTNDYSPSFYTCSISTLLYQCENLINLAEAINTVCEDQNLTTRYGDPYVIATDYDKYVWGYYFYVMKELEEKNIDKKSVAILSSTEDNGATWTMPERATTPDQKKPNRLVEYCRDNTDLLSDEIGTSATLQQVLDCDVVIATGEGAADTLRSAASAAGVSESDLPMIIDTLPTCLYGMIMQTHENGLGIPYFMSIIYSDELDLNPVYAAAYFYQNFFHITDNQALQETTNTLLASATLPDSVTTSLTNYDPESIEEKIIEGMDYAEQIQGKRHDDTEVWQPDRTVGIGSSSTDEDTLPFTDVSEDSWAYDFIEYVYDNDLFAGTSATTFSPEMTMDRAQIITVLYRMSGSPSVSTTSNFTDVKSTDYYYSAVNWAVQNGITSGVSDTEFAPDRALTREEIATFLHRYAGTPDSDQDLSQYTDSNQIMSYALTAMKWANSEGYITGTSSTTLEPLKSATRAEVASIIARYSESLN
ncbi:MAG: S-layer homology domain-containing protein [Anaerovoracaceae bacterium]